MKKVRKVFIFGIIGVLLLSMTAAANSILPGTEEDPVVTVSYVENKINELKAYMDERLNGLNISDSQTPEENTGVEENDENVWAATGNGIAFKVINMGKDQSLIGGESTEIILRSGTAIAIDNGVDGLSDITVGKDIKGGALIDRNHLLIVPRDDGRGILATSEVWLMVKGDYEIR